MRRSRFNALLGVLSFVMILVSTRAATAQVTLVVDSSGNGDYTAIQPAIDAASDGDTVELVPGTYRERINLGGKKITLRGSTGLSFLHILSRPEGGSGRLVSMNGGEDATTVIEGMTIRQSTDGGMYLNNASPTIRNCRFVENTVGSEGGAVSINGTSTPRFEDCEFSDNAASGGTNIRGGAIFMTGAGVDVAIVDCAFNRNLSRANQRESRADGGAICLRSGSRLEITGCTFDSNLVSAQSDSYYSNASALAIGGAIQAESDTAVVVVGCHFVGNEAHVDIFDNDSGGGYYYFTYGRDFGGAIDITTRSSLTVRQTTFDSHRLTSYQSTNSNGSNKRTYAEFGGTVISARGDSVDITLEDVDITGGEITQEFGSPWNNYLDQPRRGQLWVQNGSTTSIDLLRVDFVDGFGDEGGAIYTRDNAGPLTITDCTFENCSVRESGGYEGYGGAIYRRSGEMTISGTSFIGCEADRRGGAIYAFDNAGPLVLADCSFEDCRVQNQNEVWGGALCFLSSPTTTITGSTFTGNVVEHLVDGTNTYSWGGGLFQAGGTLTMDDTTFQSNRAIGDGGGGSTRHAGGAAIYLDNVFANFTQVDFLDNVASAPGTGSSYAKGGAIHAYGNYSSFKRCRFEGNQTITGNGSNDDEGGAFFGRTSTRPSFFYCDFANNSARRGGAHFYESGCEPFLIGTSLRGNAAIEAGGAFYSESATPYILGCAFQANDAPDGGAIKSTGSGTSLPYVVDVEFCGNSIDDISGDILGGDGNTSISTCEGDCNDNGIPDIDEPEVPDVDGNGIPDTCETDCDEDGLPDLYQLSEGLGDDCNGNGVPDACDIADGVSSDADENGVPDECDGRGEPGGRTLLVPFDYDSIQDAINDAVDGDEVVVAPGVYYEKINYGSRKIAIRSVGGSEVTYIDGNNQNGNLVLCENVSGAGAVLEGFTLWYAQGGHAIRCNQADLLVRDCELLFNFDSAVYLNEGTPVFERCRFEGNNSGGSGGAAFLTDTNARFLECEFLENTASNGGAIWGRYSSGVPVVIDCDFIGNDANDHGGAIRAQEQCRIDVDDCRFVANEARYGGAIAMDSADMTIDLCTFDDNIADSYGGAVYHNSCSEPAMRTSVLRGNTADERGGTIYHLNSGNPTLIECEILGGSADRGGGLYMESTKTGRVVDTLISGGSSIFGGGVYLASSEPTFENVDVVQNTASSDGGGYYCENAPALVYFGRVGSNVAASGGGVYATGPRPVFAQMTFCGNSPDDFVGDVDQVAIQFDDRCAFDCNQNDVVDYEEIDAGDVADCNGNDIPDSCEIADGSAADLNQNDIPDPCESCFAAPVVDCNANGIPDACDIESGASTDCDTDGTPDECQAEQDADGDGTPDCIDGCPNDPDKTEAGDCGCGVSDADTDGDGTPDCTDECPDDPEKIAAGDCGCGVSDVDTDADGTPDCTDDCPNDADKIAPGDCGCGIAEQDTDGDGTPDCVDGCPSDPDKIDPGACGCGIPDLDSDGDGTPNCLDGCPSDPDKTESGDCGCGVPETDSDADGTPDCVDGCPDDPAKAAPGDCGCGVPETDTDGDGTPDCVDVCPDTFDDQSDCDGDGVGDACDTDFADCNDNGVPDGCDIDDGISNDVDGDGVPDECEPDCNDNGLPDAYEIAEGLVADCNLNSVPDSCDIEVGTVLDCNANGVPDGCDIDAGDSNDVDGNGIPDECKDDCNGNGLPDGYEVAEGLVPDCDGNGVPDACDVAGGFSVDCDGDGVPDTCQILDDATLDEDANGVLDLCEYDCNDNGVSDLVDIALGDEPDCNLDQVPDSCQILDGSFEDRNNDEVPDDCQRIDWSGLAIETIAPRVYLGDPDLPTTALVYRIWAEFDDPTAELLMVFGDEIDPWTFSADGGFFQHDFGTGSSVSQLCGDEGMLGNMIHDSWVTIGRECLDDNQLGQVGFLLDDFEAGDPLFVDDGAIFLEPGDAQSRPDADGRVLIAQLTTLTGAPPTGSVNLLGRNGDQTDWIAYGMELPTPELVDCNQNGVHDAVDIATLSSDDCDGTGVPDECEDPTALLDCDFDGQSDYCEILNGTSEDGNANQVPDDCECLGDSNGDGIVNVDDLVMLLLSWGDTGPSPSDWNGDGRVNGADLALQLAGYGGCL